MNAISNMKTDNYELKIAPCSSSSWSCCQLTLRNSSLAKSIVHKRMIPGIRTNDLDQSILFPARSVQTLSSKLTVNKVAKLIRDISKQMAYLLEEESCSIMGFHPNDILVINDSIYVYVGSLWVVPYDRVSGMAIVTCPYTKDDIFLSPELKEVHELPAQVHYKTCYFSLGCLVLYAILGGLDQEYAKQSHDELLDLLVHHPIKGTRIFWLLSRCFIEDPTLRSILLL